MFYGSGGVLGENTEDAYCKVREGLTYRLPELPLQPPTLVRWHKTKQGFPWMVPIGMCLVEHLVQASLAV